MSKEEGSVTTESDLEMKGFTQIEGQSTQGSDKQCLLYLYVICE